MPKSVFDYIKINHNRQEDKKTDTIEMYNYNKYYCTVIIVVSNRSVKQILFGREGV